MGEPQRHVWLNGERLPIKGAVSWRRITPFPSQFMTTAPTENDYTPTRKQKWGTLNGGMGKDKWTPKDNDRYQEADGVDASQELQTLGSLVTTLGTFGAQPVKIIKYAGKIWAIGNNQISYWDNTAWVSVKTDLPDATDALVFYGST